MIKRIIVVVLLLAGLLLAYNWYTTGRLTLVPARTLSAEETEIDSLLAEVRRAAAQFAQAGRAAAVSGVDTTADAEAARREIARVRKRLEKLRREASETVKSKIQRLEEEIEKARREMGLD